MATLRILFIFICSLGSISHYKVSAACTWPTVLAGSTWRDSRYDAITFGSTDLSGYRFIITSTSSVTTWNCVASDTFSTDGKLLLVSASSFSLYSTTFYAYICLTLTQITNVSYRYYVSSSLDANLNNQRVLVYPVSTLTDKGTICNDNNGAQGGEYQMLIRLGQESSAKIMCPWSLLARYGYSHTTSGGVTTCSDATSEMNLCTDTSHVTFNYTLCPTKVAYSTSNTVWCVGNVVSGSTNYLSVYNGNDGDATIDNSNTYLFSCMAMDRNGSSASIAPRHCRAGQVPGLIPTSASGTSIGAKLTITSNRGPCPSCPDLTAPDLGTVTITSTDTVTSAAYTCDADYSLHGVSVRTCQTNNTWTSTQPYCSCANPSSPANGKVKVNSEGTEASYTCNVGYTVSGPVVRICNISTSSWDSTDPSCVECASLPDGSGRSYILSTNGTSTLAVYSCSAGYTLTGTQSIGCLEDGTWQYTQPVCVACALLTNPQSGTVLITTNGQTSIAAYTCSTGYSLVGNPSRTCYTNGAWNGSQPTCVCQEPSSPTNGAVVADGTTATYACSLNYTISGEATRTCQSDGTGWSGTNPSCTHCNVVNSVAGGSVVFTTTGTVTSAKFTCLVGYSLSGTSPITCSSTGSWSSAEPICVLCQTLTSPASGTVQLATSGTRTSATYSCGSGYNLNGNAIRLCNTDGTWTLTQPTCTCQNPPSPLNGQVVSDGSTATYTCSKGYSLNGASVRTCGTDGSGWTSGNPTCSTCATLTAPTGGNVTLSTDGQTTQAVFSCQIGYTLNGITPITCRADGTWDFTQPTCSQCPSLSDPASGSVTLTLSGTTTIATFTCAADYYLSGTAIITCQANGQWSKSAPTCKCNFPTTPSNGATSVTDGQTGTVASYTCVTGYSLSGLSTRVCQTDGTGWEGTDPQCVVCGTLTIPSGGTFTLATNGTHSAATFTCSVSFSLLGNQLLTCQSSGSWSSSSPTCVSCPTLDAPASGSVSLSTSGTVSTATFNCVSGYTVYGTATLNCVACTASWDKSSPTCICTNSGALANGLVTREPSTSSSVSYTCNTGYVLIGSDTRTCLTNASGWNGVAPSYAACAVLTSPSGGVIHLASNGLTTSANYSCQTGYTIMGTSQRVCQSDTSWVPTAPICVQCLTLNNPSGGSVTMATNGHVTTASYSCVSRYSLVGSSTRSCQTDGSWTGLSPSCVCDDPTIPAYGAVVADGSVARYTCNQGYTLSGDATRSCTTDGTGWSNVDPTCVLCSNLTIPTGGTFTMATSGTQTYASLTCAQGYSLSGINVISCLSDGSWSQQPTCVQCESLINPSSGSITYASNGSMTTATYSCSSGYYLVGNNQQTCRNDGSWTNTPPTCLCNPPVTTSHGAVVANGTTASYTCDVGYSLGGQATRTCSTDGTGWDGTQPTCTVCATLASLTGGSITMTTDSLQTTASYTCNVGYTLTGVRSIICRGDGTWDFSQPVCVSCPSLEAPDSGNITMTTNNYRTIASFTCESGYFLSGQLMITCQTDGQWSASPPICKCNFPMAPSNGAVSVTNPSSGQVASYSCNHGYTINGVSSRQCLSDGSGWDGTDPSCTACASVSPPALLEFSTSTNGTHTLGQFTCAVNYTLVGMASQTCLHNGSWSHMLPNCTQCMTLINPSGGSLTMITNGHVTTASYSCVSGYILVGSGTRSCQTNGRWTGTSPTCVCEDPVSPTHGAVVADGAMAMYTCNQGYTLSGAVTRTCYTNGTGWSDADPSCATCSSLTISTGGTFTMATTGTQTFASLTCTQGYSISGTATVNCLSDGTWSQQPICTQCESLTNPSSASITYASNGSMTSATYSCSSGYYLVGNNQQTCKNDGSWTNTPPTCLCNSPVAPSHGAVVANGTAAKYSCDVGYSLSGLATRTCNTDGTGWGDTNPTCTACATLASLTGGTVTMSTDSLQTTASFTCNAEYTLNGVRSITCRGDGTWDFSQPYCVSCPSLDSPDSGNVTLTTNNYRTTASFTCESGYFISGHLTLTCQTNGQWSASPPICKCNFPIAPSNGAVSVTNPSSGQVASYSCNHGYTINGTSSRQCLTDGASWDGTDPSCTVCDSVSPPALLEFSTSTNGTHTLGHFMCDVNYTLVGVASQTCLHNGSWSHMLPTCVPCEPRTHPDSGHVAMTTSGQVTIATYTCSIGYGLTSTGILTCLTTGSWDLPEPSCECLHPGILSDGQVAVHSANGRQVVNYTCDNNYDLIGPFQRVCQPGGLGWNGTQPRCEPTDPPAVGASTNKSVLSINVGVLVALLIVIVVLVIALFTFWYRKYRRDNQKVSAKVGEEEKMDQETFERGHDLENGKTNLIGADTEKKTKFNVNRLNTNTFYATPPAEMKLPKLLPDKSPIPSLTPLQPVTTDNPDTNQPLSSVRLPKIATKPPLQSPTHRSPRKKSKNKKEHRRERRSKKSDSQDLPPITITTHQEATDVEMNRIDTPSLLASEEFGYIRPVYTPTVRRHPSASTQSNITLTTDLSSRASTASLEKILMH